MHACTHARFAVRGSRFTVHIGRSYIGATTWQIHASDWLHNLDKKISFYFNVYNKCDDKKQLKKRAVETELACFGKDMVSISLAMTTSQLLWFGTPPQPPRLSLVCSLCVLKTLYFATEKFCWDFAGGGEVAQVLLPTVL